MALTDVASDVAAGGAPDRRTERALGYLRGFVTLMVVAHHAMLAYHPFAPPPGGSLADSPWWRAFPIVDGDRCGAFTYLVAFNDNFFMSLMFLLSGLFVWRSLERKGPARFLRDRAIRLGVPFALSLILLAPLAYFPTYLQMGGTSVAEFARAYIHLAPLPTGPAWFLWVLLAFDILVAGVYAVTKHAPAAASASAPAAASSVAGAGSAAGPRFPRNPVIAFALLVALSAAAYIPLADVVGGMSWDGIGPFQLQIGRALHYTLYFAIGIAAGARLDRSFVPALARGWFVWAALAAGAFYVALRWETAAMLGGSAALGNFGFVVTCAASSFAMIAIFARFASRPLPALAGGLRDNAYGIYLLHYAAVSWLQYGLLGVALSGLAKGALVTGGAIAISALVSAGLRRERAIARWI